MPFYGREVGFMKRIALYGEGDYELAVRLLYEKLGYEVCSVSDLAGEDPSGFQIMAALEEGKPEKAIEEIEKYLPGCDRDSIIFQDEDEFLELSKKASPLRPEEFLKKAEPLSRFSGLDRGEAIDRYYIENFLLRESKGLKGAGCVLEVGEDAYSKEYFPDAEHDILNYEAGMDLTKPETLPFEKYDVFICTQTFSEIFEVRKAIAGAWSVLKPGGTLLASVCGLATQLSREPGWDHYWGFTEASLRLLLKEQFGENVRVKGFGNAMAATAFLQGVSLEEVDTALLDINDSDFSVCICAVARK